MSGDHTDAMPLSVLTTRSRTSSPGCAASSLTPTTPLSVPAFAVLVQDRHLVDVRGTAGVVGLHHQRPEQPPLDLDVGDLVGVVPVAARVVGDEAVDVGLAGHHGVLGDAGDPIGGVDQVDAVPVQGGSVGDVVVDQSHLDEVTLGDPQRRAGRGSR